MTHFGKFLRRHLGKYFNSPQREAAQRVEISQSETDPSSVVQDGLVDSPDTEPASNFQKSVSRTSKEDLLRLASGLSKSSSVESTGIKSQIEVRRSTEQSQPYNSLEQVNEDSQACHHAASADDAPPIVQNKSEAIILESAGQSVQNVSEGNAPSINSTKRINASNPNLAATGVAESVQAVPPPVRGNRDPGRKNDVPIHITVPELALRSAQKSDIDADHAAEQLMKTVADGQHKDMLSGSQNVPKPQELPANSTSLRNYLESTSARTSRPRQVLPNNSPNKLFVSPPEKSASADKGPSDPKDACPHNDEKSRSTPDCDPSLVTLVEVSDSTKAVVETAMKKFGMKEMTTEGYWNVRWSDNGVSMPVCQKLRKYQKINRFPGSGLLMTKNNLAKTTIKMKQMFPEEYDFVPETWCLSGDISKVEHHARVHDRDCFIVKPNDGSSGKGIIITRNIAKLKMFDKMVCQVYIRKPFLIDGYKFDLRIYTLITSCRPLRLFVYNEGLARFATELYEEPNQQNESNRYMHLTNYAVNKRSPSYTINETKGTLRRLTTINKWLERHNVDAKNVWESMDEAIVKTIISFLPALRHNYRVSFPDQTDSNSCFQILGFDIIFDENLKPYVLEVNDSPSFKADVPLDKEMTESLMHDTFNILHLDENNRSKVLTEERRLSRLRLLSSSMQNRTAIHKEKEQSERQLTQSRSEWENAHMGNYRKVFPNEQKMKHYKKFIRASQDIFLNT